MLIIKLVNTTCVAQPEGGTRICEVNGWLLAIIINKIRMIEGVVWCVGVMASDRMTSRCRVQFHSLTNVLKVVRSVYYVTPKLQII